MRIRILALAATLLFTTLAHATAPGLYLGAQVGEANLHNQSRLVQNEDGSISSTPTPDNTGVGGRFFMGGNFNPYVGMELGLAFFTPSDYKLPSGGSASVNEGAFDIVGKGMLPIQNFTLFVKAGGAVVVQSIPSELALDSTTKTTTYKVLPTASIGASYDFTQNWVADISYNRIFKGGDIQAIDFIALGISYHFVEKSCGQFLC